MSKGKLIILSGPSGAGKSTVVNKAIEKRGNICFSVSVTTRKPREGEIDGRDYFFIDADTYDRMLENNELLEHARYVNNCYGTPASFVNEKLEAGMNVVLDIEIQGAWQVKQKIPDAVTIFILPPSMALLEHRLKSRGTDSPEAVAARIERARQEIQEADFYDYLIVNRDVDLAADQFLAILDAEHCRFQRSVCDRVLSNEACDELL